jgi:hypothetical protein
MTAYDAITLIQAYDAMRIFLETVWRRRGCPSGEVDLLIAGLKLADGTPVDSTLWNDWLAAVQIVASGEHATGSG